MLRRSKDVALAGLWITLASAHSKIQVQIALGVVAVIQLMLVWQQWRADKLSETPHIGGGLTSSVATKETS